jgi:3-oxoacyl-[acyl-carrier protein] reductase
MVEDLRGQVALVTGVSRRAGIGFAIARRLLDDGAAVFCQSWSAHDEEQPWGGDALGPEGVIDALGAPPDRIRHLELDLVDAASPGLLVSRVVEAFGHVDILVVNHARSSAQSLSLLTADELDRSWAINARATVLLVQAYAAQYDASRECGRVVLFTSGQHRAPMNAELPYAISKGAVHQMTLTLADTLADRGITVNTVNPGPTDTGWASPEEVAQVEAAMPLRRWNQPEEIAAVVRWLVGRDATTITGQVIDAEGGFRRGAR